MHLRPDHAVHDLPTLHAFIRQHPLGLLTTSLPSTDFPTLQCTHIPWVLDPPEGFADADLNSNSNSKPEKGKLRGHIARTNPHTRAMVQAVTGTGRDAGSDFVTADASGTQGLTLPGEVLIVFTSPIDHYISPHFYTETKNLNGKVAPTWNYAAVQVYGRMVVYHDVKDKKTGRFLMDQLGDLARLGEVGVMGYTSREGWNDGTDVERGDQGRSPWEIADAPREYIETLKKGIVGMEVEITRVEGRFKVSQEKRGMDREGVVGGLEAIGSARASEMARFVRSGRVV
ncbi:hypothetical protein N7532_007541 [Penicillium argentinense]|uniref:Transcriptional regulator n=1 Tax=Penicillium argentinense TaxID=1131581 RepID=A0A9W9K737_9EURO|nr:uncharacterized protein N7532_007541 [Penicillium argentinense]KAJ5095250.1 hypothetical protein N7532_007541 [Penicillium argentinense]